MDVLSIKHDEVRLAEGWPIDETRQRMADLIANRVSAGLRGSTLACLRTAGKTGRVALDSMLFPREIDWLAFWVIEFGVAERQFVDDRLWPVIARYEPLFIDAARSINAAYVHGARSIADLKAKIERDEENGRLAEQWVLGFEKRRLSTHPLRDQVVRVSDDNVNAGYDIASFLSIGSLHYDCFIEVKSYTGHKRFYWTRNEISTARLLGEKYCLYLVDRDKMGLLDYSPQIIPGPYSALFESKASGWEISPSVYECEIVAPDQAGGPK